MSEQESKNNKSVLSALQLKYNILQEELIFIEGIIGNNEEATIIKVITDEMKVIADLIGNKKYWPQLAENLRKVKE